MKPQNFSGDSSLIQESKRTIGENFRQVIKAAMVAVAGNNGRSGSSRPISFSREMERRNGNMNYGVEDPIRTMMFLGSWSHT
ncbi:hypothetical protein Vadar_008059 [Vaccinium darrowii]|uniref:Uncharacterized protein n=1 Tax=Vaccinium darrowii TaxID=229202 RepID=A0ACB7ZAQ3_9ERIC|nr:hypothetical protein Vadar_008059 [Vaccinium darrowii]